MPLPPEAMSDSVRIREEQASDAPDVYQVHLRAFGGPDEADLVDRLRACCTDRLSLVAEAGSRIVGHVLFTPVDLETPAACIRGVGLGPVGVLPEVQRQGIGGALIRQGLEAVRQTPAPLVVVVGEPAYYRRFGFVPARNFGVTCEFAGVPEEAFMMIALDPEALGGASGVVRYHPEFRSVA